jgi:hypothetical protein
MLKNRAFLPRFWFFGLFFAQFLVILYRMALRRIMLFNTFTVSIALAILRAVPPSAIGGASFVSSFSNDALRTSAHPMRILSCYLKLECGNETFSRVSDGFRYRSTHPTDSFFLHGLLRFATNYFFNQKFCQNMRCLFKR